jgi:hypothetical protein
MTPKEMIKELIFKGYSYNEIARFIGGYPELLSAIVRGHTNTSGKPKVLNPSLLPKLKDLHEESKRYTEGEYKYGVKRDWIHIINSLQRRGFSYQHIADICCCKHTHIRDCLSPKRRKAGKCITPMVAIQEKLLDLYRDTTRWPSKPCWNGNQRTHKNITFIKTIGSWQV